MAAGLSAREIDDIRVLLRFVSIFCRERHRGEKSPLALRQIDVKDLVKDGIFLCDDCRRIIRYAVTMRLRCPHAPKPPCKKCPTKCYHPEYRQKIREIMKFSGIHLIKHGRLDMIYHYFK